MIIEAKDVSLIYGDNENCVAALNHISFQIKEKEIVCLYGPSGCGKSSILNAISGLENINSGEIIYDGRSFSSLRSREKTKIRLNDFSFIFQQYHLITSLNVYDNIVFSAIMKKQGVDKEYYNNLISYLGIENRQKHMPQQLSGGEKQRVSIARALISNPKVIFADEPTGALDSVNADKVFELLIGTAKEMSKTLIYVTHDYEKAKLADRVIFMKDGEIIEQTE